MDETSDTPVLRNDWFSCCFSLVGDLIEQGHLSGFWPADVNGERVVVYTCSSSVCAFAAQSILARAESLMCLLPGEFAQAEPKSPQK